MKFGFAVFTITLVELLNNGVIGQNDFEIITIDEGFEACDMDNS